jgi:hypothetical protein
MIVRATKEVNWLLAHEAKFINCASPMGEELQGLGLLPSEPSPSVTEKWQFDANSRLFLQLNQSEVLSEFMTAMMNLHAGESSNKK